jgi:Flp pilus assembly protein TadG
MHFRTLPWRRRLRQTTGQSLVEAAIVLPLLLVVTFAVIDFSWFLFSHMALQNGVSEAARYGITGQAKAGMTRTQSIMQAMRDATPTLDIRDEDFNFTHLVGGNWVSGVGGPGEIERLRVTHVHDVLVFRPLFPNGRITIQAESAMKNEARFN